MTATPAPRPSPLALLLPAVIIGLAVVAGVIHLSLGALMFTLNALGYFGLAVLYAIAAYVSHPLVARFAWGPRVALPGYAMLSILAWLVVGGFYDLGYITKALEVVLIALVIVDVYRVFGGIPGLIEQATDSARWALGTVRRQASDGS